MPPNFRVNPRQKAPRSVFLATTIVIFFLSLSAADSIDFVPCYMDASCNAVATEGPQSVPLSDLPELGTNEAPGTRQQAIEEKKAPIVLPDRIVIPSVNIDLPVQNPATRDTAALDELLKNGPVRYVDSAKLGEKGNVLIFAHTSHLPVVKNQMYKAFNRIPELKVGDSITLRGEGKSYLYTVRAVRKAEVDEAVIDLSPTQGQKLTLVTCDTLTGKSARFILTATFVGTI